MSRAEGQRPTPDLSAPELLAFLGARGGQEYSVALVTPAAPARKKGQVPAPAPQRPRYCFTLRGAAVEATGPAGLTRQLSQAAFLQVFGAHRFAELTPTGQLSDLGPLFAAP
ncbi:hypothetical protein GCM10022631_12290 [Deinococcus rubellus]|uniref:Uncharacterized protein n=1 Tax=Deinococcus rubellus TaxID=1889240 RepID=A0ABY5YCS7_9DEIO|nr:hypothetical protein [Deinococcus rubellus]UWX62726.1 hypothetical protein N0D28_08060 [Deinococcus rubellus]